MSHYAPEDLGRPCGSCGARVVRAVGFHPCCGAEARALLERRRPDL